MKRGKAIGILSLFTSTSTLLCCALPSILAAIAGSSAVVSLLGAFPFLITLSKYKLWLFIIAGVLLAIAFYITFRRARSCPADPESYRVCKKAIKTAKIVLWISLGIYFIGLLFSYILPFFLF